MEKNKMKQVMKLAKRVLKIALFGWVSYRLYSVLGIGIVFLLLGIALVVVFFYFLAMCLAAGLENKFGEADASMWRKPEQLPVYNEMND
jgi:hypothetical protein